MLKHSSESKFNSLMAGTLPYHLPLSGSTAPWILESADFGSDLTQRKVIRCRAGLTHSQTPALRTSHSSHKLSNSLLTATLKYSLMGKAPPAAAPTFRFL